LLKMKGNLNLGIFDKNQKATPLNSIMAQLQSNNLEVARALVMSHDDDETILPLIQEAQFSEDVLEILASSDWWQLLVALVLNHHVPNDLKKRILTIPKAGIYHYEVQQAVLTNPNLDASLVEMVLAGQSPKMWSHLSDDEIFRRKGVLQAASVSRSDQAVWVTLGALASSDGGVEEAVAIWERVFGSAPEKSNQQSDFEELRSCAMHPLTSRETLVHLSFSNDDEIESLIASNPSSPPCIVAYYAESLSSNGAPSSLALANPVVPSYVWEWFQEMFETFQDQDWPPNQLLLTTAAMNHGLPLEVMELLAAHPREDVRQELASNICLPDSIRESIIPSRL
jgi:hypothetical protein